MRAEEKFPAKLCETWQITSRWACGSTARVQCVVLGMSNRTCGTVYVELNMRRCCPLGEGNAQAGRPATTLLELTSVVKQGKEVERESKESKETVEHTTDGAFLQAFARLLHLPGHLTAYVVECSTYYPDSSRGCSRMWGLTEVWLIPGLKMHQHSCFHMYVS